MPRTNGSTYTLSVGGVPVEVTRKSVRNVNIRIHDDGTVHMSVPWHVTREQARALAEGRTEWIREMRQRALAHARTTAHLWQTGETLDVWGVPRRVEVQVGGTEGARLADGRLIIDVMRGQEGDEDASVRLREAYVEELLVREARDAISEMLPRLEAKVGRRATSVTLRRMRTRWGSCTTSKGTIRINTALAEHPRSCLEMVLTHELCHLIEPNHGPRFHALMDRLCPGWRELQHYLDENPPRVNR